MCHSQASGSCCPPAQVFQEKLCGNFSNISGIAVTQAVWIAAAGEYVDGTFEIFNSAASTAAVTGSITSTPIVPDIVVPPGFTVSSSASSPTLFEITIPPGASGTFCVTVYKRILA